MVSSKIKFNKIDFEVYCHQNEKDMRRAWFTHAYVKTRIESNMIFYEYNNGEKLSGQFLEVFLKLFKNRNEYKHVLAVKDLSDEFITKYSTFPNIVIVEYDSKDYISYICKAEYCITNSMLPSYFIRKEMQKCIYLYDPSILSVKEEIKYAKFDGVGNVQRSLFQFNYIVSQSEQETKTLLATYSMEDIYQGKLIFSDGPQYEDCFAEDSEVLHKDFLEHLGSEKEKILFYPGGMKNNGLTNSFINLTYNLDYDRYEYYAIFDRFGKDRIANIQKIHPKIKKIYKSGYYGFLAKEYNQYHFIVQNGIKKSIFGYKKRSIPKKLFQREKKRIFGNASFKHVINYDGYSVNWTALMAFGGFKDKIIYQHADMKSEMTRKVNGQRIFERLLKAIFTFYDFYDKIVTVSTGVAETNKKSLKELTFKSADKVTVVENFLRPNLILEKAKEGSPYIFQGKSYYPIHLRANESKFFMDGIEMPNNTNINFVCSGRLSYEKGHKKLLKALKKVLKEKKNIRLYIIGDGPLKNDIQNEIKKLDLHDYVIMTGHLDNPFYLINLMDCFVMASDHEGQGMVLLEALILNKYCICTDIDGPRSFLKEEFGELVGNSWEGLAEGMLNYIDKKPKPEEFPVEKYNRKAKADFYNMLES